MEKPANKVLTQVKRYLPSNQSTRFSGTDLQALQPLSSCKKNSPILHIRHPYICCKCRRLKIQGFHGSFPPKNFCICPSDTQLVVPSITPTTIRLPSAPLKNFIATGTSIYSKQSEFSVSDLALTRIANIIKSSNSPTDKSVSPCTSNIKNKESQNKFKFLVHPGNNSKLVKSIIEQKPAWVEGNFSNSNEAQFIWQPTSKNIKFIRLAPYLPRQVINHFEGHSEISNKSNLFNNLNAYCKENSLNALDFIPATFCVDLKSNRVNSQIGLFVGFFKNLAGDKGVKGGEEVVGGNVCETHYCGKNVWIIKPADFNRGRGIRIFNSLEVFRNIIAECVSDMHNKRELQENVYIIQKYIESPLLINNRKFDIRVWVLVTHKLGCYFYKHGYIRTSSEKYSLDDSLLSNQYIHLTNNAIQKESSLYEKYELGNQLSFESFQDYLNLQYPGKFSLVSLIEDMKLMIKHTLSSVKKKLNPNNREFCFEIFGFDFILDSNGRIWLIECNTNPCIELSSPLLGQLIPNMIKEAFNLTIDTIFPVPNQSKLNPNNWEFLQSLKNNDKIRL